MCSNKGASQVELYGKTPIKPDFANRHRFVGLLLPILNRSQADNLVHKMCQNVAHFDKNGIKIKIYD